MKHVGHYYMHVMNWTELNVSSYIHLLLKAVRFRYSLSYVKNTWYKWVTWVNSGLLIETKKFNYPDLGPLFKSHYKISATPQLFCNLNSCCWGNHFYVNKYLLGSTNYHSGEKYGGIPSFLFYGLLFSLLSLNAKVHFCPKVFSCPRFPGGSKSICL